MSVSGLISPRTVTLSLFGRGFFTAGFVGSNGEAYPLTGGVATVGIYASPSAVTPLVELTTSGGQVTALNTAGQIAVRLTDVQAATLSAGRLYHLQIFLSVDGTLALATALNTFDLIPINQAINWNIAGEITMALSTSFLNTQILLGQVGGVGYLNGISTIVQPVGCMIQFYLDPSQPPQQWVLRAGTDAAVTDAVVRPLDYHVSTNAKVWLRIS